jgi:hypothetical protein
MPVRKPAVLVLRSLCDEHAVNKDAIREAGGIPAMVRLLIDADTRLCKGGRYTLLPL